MQRHLLPLGLGLALLLTACDDTAVEAPPEPIRAIKYMTVSAGAAAQQRRLAGIIAAGTSSVAAFETAGQVTELSKKVGDAVAAGEVLATLDPEPFQLRLAEANAVLAQARASVSDAQSKHSQQKQLFDRGYATRTAYESALAALRNARGSLGVAQSQVQIARRNLDKTALKAPFAGVVARRAVEPFEEVASGQEVYTLQTENDTEVNVSLPETMVTVVSVGDPVKVVVSLLGPEPIQGTVAEIAPLAEGVNAYPVTVRLVEAPAVLRPGMSAEVVFEFEPLETTDALTIPISALRPVVDEQGGVVYVFADGQVRERKVQVANIRDNALQVVGELQPGDVIATAGVSLLHDGMKVRLLDPATLR